MAVHAGFRRRHSGGSGGFDRSVAVAAVNAIVTDVMPMAELNRLSFNRIRLIPVGGTGQTDKNIIDCEHRERAGSDDRRSRERIRALIKNLPHQEK